MSHNFNVKDTPEMIALCTNCKRPRCSGMCEEYKRARRAVSGDGRGRRPKLHEIDGERLTIAEWAARIGVSRQLIESRLKKGKTIKEALEMGPNKAVKA